MNPGKNIEVSITDIKLTLVSSSTSVVFRCVVWRIGSGTVVVTGTLRPFSFDEDGGKRRIVRLTVGDPLPLLTPVSTGSQVRVKTGLRGNTGIHGGLEETRKRFGRTCDKGVIARGKKREGRRSITGWKVWIVKGLIDLIYFGVHSR